MSEIRLGEDWSSLVVEQLDHHLPVGRPSLEDLAIILKPSSCRNYVAGCLS